MAISGRPPPHPARDLWRDRRPPPGHSSPGALAGAPCRHRGRSAHQLRIATGRGPLAECRAVRRAEAGPPSRGIHHPGPVVARNGGHGCRLSVPEMRLLGRQKRLPRPDLQARGSPGCAAQRRARSGGMCSAGCVAQSAARGPLPTRRPQPTSGRPHARRGRQSGQRRRGHPPPTALVRPEERRNPRLRSGVLCPPGQGGEVHRCLRGRRSGVPPARVRRVRRPRPPGKVILRHGSQTPGSTLQR